MVNSQPPTESPCWLVSFRTVAINLSMCCTVLFYPGRRGENLRVLFGITLFLSGALLFLVEPMFAKMALPRLGGTPAVWNVCMVSYQALLLAGYAYSHEVAKRFTSRRTALLQVGITLAAFFALPIRLPDLLSSPLNQSPTLWLLMLLAVGMGLPFLVLSTYSSLLQTFTQAPLARLSMTPTLFIAPTIWEVCSACSLTPC
jgi:hypothetical protein